MPEQNISANKGEILRHIEHLTRRWGELDEPVLLEVVHLSADDRAQVKQVSHYTADALGLDIAADDIAGMNQHRINCYATVNPVSATNRPPAGKRASAEHIVAAFFQFADADDKQAADNIRNFVGPKCNFLVLTGTQPCVRPHVYWELEEPTRNLKAWTATQVAISDTLKTDRVIDPPRIMRLAGTINWPKPQKQAKGYVAELTTLRIFDDRPVVTSERMARAFAGATAAQSGPSDGFQVDTGPQPLDRERARIQALSGAEWHNSVKSLVASYVARGFTDAEILTQCEPLTLAGYTVEQTAQEVAELIEWTRREEGKNGGEYAESPNGAPQEYATPTFDVTPAEPQAGSTLDWFEDVSAQLSDTYIVKGVLSAEALSAVYGPSNSGKTFFVMDLAFHIAAGIEWRGRRVRQSAVLYLASEGGRGVLNRMVAIKQHTGIATLPFAARRAGLDLLQNTADLQTVYDLAKEVQAKSGLERLVIVIDTLSRAMAGGDENSAQDMTALIRNIDAIRAATNAHVILVHHTGKDAGRGARGHSSLRAAVDTEIELQVDEEWRGAVVSKQREYSGGETFAFDLKSVALGFDQDGDEVSSCVVIEADEERARKPRKLSKNQRILTETFDTLKGEGVGGPNPGGAMMPEPGQYWAMPMDTFREAAEGKLTAKNTRSAFLDAFDALNVSNGTFCMASGFVWRTDKRI